MMQETTISPRGSRKPFFYRKRIQLASTVIAALITAMVYFLGYDEVLVVFYAIYAWFLVSCILENTLYEFMGKKESSHVGEVFLKEKCRMSAKHLDLFFRKISWIKTFIVVVLGLFFIINCFFTNGSYVAVLILAFQAFFVLIGAFHKSLPRRRPHLSFLTNGVYDYFINFSPATYSSYENSFKTSGASAHRSSSSSSFSSSSSSSAPSFSSSSSYYSYSNSPGRDQSWKR